MIKNKPIPDGEYLIEKGYKKLYIFGKQITQISYMKKYDVVKSTQVIIEQKTEYDFEKGDNVWMDGEIAKDGKYKINQYPDFIVQNGVIIKVGIKPENIVLISILSIILCVFTFVIIHTFFNK